MNWAMGTVFVEVVVTIGVAAVMVAEIVLAGRVMPTVMVTVVVLGGMERQEQAVDIWPAAKALR